MLGVHFSFYGLPFTRDAFKNSGPPALHRNGLHRIGRNVHVAVSVAPQTPQPEVSQLKVDQIELGCCDEVRWLNCVVVCSIPRRSKELELGAARVREIDANR